MTLIDERGRLFGRLNFIDALVGLLGLAIVGFLVVGYLLFRLPPPPIVLTHEPATLEEMKPQRVRLTGNHFTPYLRAFLRRTDRKDFVRRPKEDESKDAFSLMNATRVPFLIETPTLGELEVPAIPAGTYDILFYDEFKLIAEQENMLKVLPDPRLAPSAVKWQPTASVLAYGAFINLKPSDASALKNGAHLVSGGVTWGDVLAAEPAAADLAQLKIGDNLVPAAAMIDRVRVAAKVRVRCMLRGVTCILDDATPVVANNVLSGTVGATPVQFRVAEVAPDAPQRSRQMTVTVRFVGRRDVIALVKAGARDAGHDQAVLPLSSERGATITSVGDPRRLNGQVQLTLGDIGLESVTTDEPLATVDATLSVPATEQGSLWIYKTQPVRSGGVLMFETAQYAVRGWILRVP
jgi:hypothetical protein